MKKIICYGDSNTFGYNPYDASRYDKKTRWCAILQDNLKAQYEVVDEGMCDRTAFMDNPNGFLFSGSQHFPKFILNSNNVYMLILWLGTNDLQFQYDIKAHDIKKGLENLIKLAKTKTKNIIIIPPVILNENILKGYFKCQFDKTSILKSKKVQKIYETIAHKHNCTFFDVNKFAKPSELDGLHYDKISHKIIANQLKQLILSFDF